MNMKKAIKLYYKYKHKNFLTRKESRYTIRSDFNGRLSAIYFKDSKCIDVWREGTTLYPDHKILVQDHQLIYYVSPLGELL